jgi:hypothetical protein
MPAYWILPNRDQQDDIPASDGKTFMPLRHVLDPKLLPAGFSHGVPTELLEKCGPKAFAEILFAQRFPCWNQNKQLFSVSSTAGLDASGRVVHLGILFILGTNEIPKFELTSAGLAKEDQSYASALLHRMKSSGRGDSWAQSVRDLSELPIGTGPATNVELDRSVIRFHSLYKAGPGGLTRKSMNWRKAYMTAIILLSLLAAGVVGFLYIR